LSDKVSFSQNNNDKITTYNASNFYHEGGSVDEELTSLQYINAKNPPAPLTGVLGGGNDDTQTFTNLINYCNAAGKTLFIPDDLYLISSPLPFPNFTQIKGNGYNTVFSLKLTSGQFCFYEHTTWKEGWGIEGIHFSIAAGGANDVGAIYTDYALRGCYIRDIWTYELYKPIYLGSSVWGEVELDNINLYLLGANDVANSCGINGNGNTIMMSNIEIIGGWQIGLQLNNCIVFKLHGFNISGSSASIQMGYPIKITGSWSGDISSGWIEQLDTTLWTTNGSGQCIYVKNSKAINIKSVYLASGSLFCDNTTVSVDTIYYGQTNGGLRSSNNARVMTTSNALGYQNISGDPSLADGELNVLDKHTHTNGLLQNPVMKQGVPHPLVVSNGTYVTFSDDTTAGDFLSSDRAIKVTTTADWHGGQVTVNNLIVGKTYTIVMKMQTLTNVGSLSLAMVTGGTTSTVYPCCMRRTGATGYNLYWYVFTATASTSSIKAQATRADGVNPAVYLIDSADVFPGFNTYDCSNYEEALISQQGRFKNTGVATGGTWQIGQTITNTAPSAGTPTAYWLRVTNGTGNVVGTDWIAK
jgi:hypothetical protein